MLEPRNYELENSLWQLRACGGQKKTCPQVSEHSLILLYMLAENCWGADGDLFKVQYREPTGSQKRGMEWNATTEEPNNSNSVLEFHIIKPSSKGV